MKNRSPGILTAITDTLSDKFIILALAAAAASIPPMDGSAPEACSTALLLTLAVLVMNIILSRKGISRAMLREHSKSLDPKVTGYISDVSGVGSLMSALAAVACALSRLYLIVDDTGGDLVLTALSIVSSTLLVGAVLGIMASADTLYRMAFISTADLTGSSGDELIKSVGKLTRSPELTGSLRRLSLISFTTQIGMSVVFVLSSLTSIGLPFPISGGAVIFVILSLITLGSGRNEVTYGDDKLRLFARGRSFGVVGTVMYITLAMLVMWSFPFRSVYTSYTIRYDYSYHDAAPEQIQIFSIPAHDADNAPLFMAIFALTAMFAVVQAFVSISYDPTFSQKSSPKAVLMIFFGMVAMGAYSMIYALFYHEYAMNAVMWLVSISLACLMLGIYLIRILIVSRKLASQSGAKNEKDSK
ncbi:MAG: hypothetical protein IKR73_09190 [Oscillospiraceae bacterium]|nr:hypothetical protein [Oscillospiraceae bacterium]